MKAISLWQPWATLVAIGAKRIETRSWSTSYRGPLAIHAAKRWTKQQMELCCTEPFNAALTKAGYLPDPENPRRDFAPLPRGCVVATCNLVACVPVETVFRANRPGKPLAHEAEFGDYTPGRWAWILEDVRPLRAMMICKGARGLFRLPMELVKGGEA